MDEDSLVLFIFVELWIFFFILIETFLIHDNRQVRIYTIFFIFLIFIIYILATLVIYREKLNYMIYII